MSRINNAEIERQHHDYDIKNEFNPPLPGGRRWLGASRHLEPCAERHGHNFRSGGQFSFNYSANVGLTYVVQKSSDLVNWSPIFTNVASSNPVHFTNNLPLSRVDYYRVARLPNP